MDEKTKRLLDNTGKRILRLLCEDARISYAEIGRRVHLSTPAVIERIEKMENAGIITGYHAHISPEALGYSVAAIVTLTTEPHHYPTVRQIVAESNTIETCDHVTGAASFIMRIRAASLPQLEDVIQKFAPIGSTETALILSSVDTTNVMTRRLSGF